MNHLTPFQGDRSRHTFHFNNSNVPKDNKPPTTNELYIGQIPNDVDGISLRMFFSQFGEIERVFEGGRRQSGGMKWAFVSYIHPEDAVNLLQQAGRIGLAGNIRPRDRSPSTMERQRERQSPPRQVNRDRSNTTQMIGPQVRPSNPSRGFPPRPPDSMGNPPWNPYPLLSKTLTVTNLPPEFTPKDLYELFSDYGEADTAFLYAFPDSKGRRVGEVVMATFLFAQKALENTDGRYIEGYAVEVSYKPAIPVPHQGPYGVPPSDSNTDYSPPPPPMPNVPPPRSMWSGPPGPNPFIAPPLPPIAPPQPPPSFPMWPFSSPPVIDVVPRIQSASPPMTAPTSTLAPEPSPPPPYSALPPTPAVESHEGLVPQMGDTRLESLPGKTPCDPCNLFIKNLDDEIIATKRDLENLFSEYGTITSAFLATYAPKDSSFLAISKGFGFVAFSRPQEADLAKEKMNGCIIGRKKIFVSCAEKKEDRQMRLKVFFANVEKLAEEMRSELNVKPDLIGEIIKDTKEERVSRRGVFRGPPYESTMDMTIPRSVGPRSSPQTPPRHIPLQGEFSKHSVIGSPARARGKFRRQRGQQSFKRFQHRESEQYHDPSFIDVDFHEDFPPLPKSVKRNQSPTLQKIAEASAIAKEQPATAVESETPDPIEYIESRPQSSGSLQGTITPLDPNSNRMDIDAGIPSHRSSVQGTPAFPRAPPPSSAELSTAGNTAPTTPTTVYVRPRITPQSLHDRLLHANATLATLQEGRPLALSRSAPISPHLGSTIFHGDIGRTWIIEGTEEISEVVESLDTTIGASAIAVEGKVLKEWTAESLIEV